MSSRAHKIMMPRELMARHKRKGAAGMLIKNAEQVITLAPGRGRPLRGEEMRDLGVLENSSVLIEDGRILGVGKSDRLMSNRSEKDYQVIDASGKVVMPGFVDPHTHIVFAGERASELSMKVEGASYLEIARSGGGIMRTVRETREASETELMDQASERLDDMLACGTTTVEAKSGYGLTTDAELKTLRVASKLAEKHPMDIISTFLGAHAIPDEFRVDRQGYVALIEEEMIPAVTEMKLADFCDVFCENGYFEAGESKRILEKGQTHGLRGKIHADEFTHSGGAQVAAEVGAITADHLVHTTEKDMGMLSRSGVVAVLLPAVPLLSMDDRYADARKMIEIGLPVALATDLNPNCWVRSMQTVIALGCYRLRMYPEEAIAASTINAAYAIGMGDQLGSIEAGKQADLLVLDVPSYLHLPYRFDHNAVETVVKAGEVVLERF